MKLPKHALLTLCCGFLPFLLSAQSPCRKASAKKDLDINMVRTTLLNGGDMWWDRSSNAKYEVPKGSKRHAVFSGAIWMGATDAGGNVKLAAQTYHQTGDDFWPGPIDSMGKAQCTTAFDRIWSVKRGEVDSYRAGGTPTTDIKEWPGLNPGLRTPGLNKLAPFQDVNGDGKYNTADGDYPLFAGKGTSAAGCDEALHGDQALWWVINDVGDIHTSSGGTTLGVEIHITAYAFNRPGNPLDSTTLYRFKIINKSTEALMGSYFGIWADADLGNPADDYVGCDVSRGIGYTYNGDNDDQNTSAQGYSSYMPNRPPPAIGVDILRGPMADPNDGKDNDYDGTIDEAGGEFINLSGFMFYDNANGTTGNPAQPQDYYNYMQGRFIDGKHLTHGGSGYPGSPGNSGVNCDHFYPDDSDPKGYSTNKITGLPLWNEAIAGNPVGDRRMVNLSGPFSMAPGSIRTVHMAMEFGWGADGGTVKSSIAAMQRASDKIQQLFDNCFSSLYTSLQNPLPVEEFKLMPNPATDQIRVSCSTQSIGILSLYNVQGQLLQSVKISGPMQMDISKLERGLLLYSFTTTKGIQNSGKIILE